MMVFQLFSMRENSKERFSFIWKGGGGVGCFWFSWVISLVRFSATFFITITLSVAKKFNCL